MPRKRPFNSVSQNCIAEDFHLNLSHHEWNGLHSKYAQTGVPLQSINAILISHVVSAVYGFLMLYAIITNKYYSSINSLYFLPVLTIHVVFEYIKAFCFHKHFNSSHKSIKQFISTYILGIVISYTFAVLFGADFFGNIESTLIFSCIITTFAVVPLFFETGTKCLLLILFQHKTTQFSQKITLSVSYCVIIGAWFGAFVIPLDWNRSWQVWPIPCVVGALLGYVVGELMCCGKILLFNLKI